MQSAPRATPRQPAVPDPHQQLESMLADAGVARAAIYQPGEVQRILCISNSSFRRYCELWEPGAHCDQYGLESIKLATHRRVTHQALVDWVSRNHTYQRENT